MCMYMYSGVLGMHVPLRIYFVSMFQNSSEHTVVGEGGSIATRTKVYNLCLYFSLTDALHCTYYYYSVW